MIKDLLFGAVDNLTWNQIKPWAQSIRDTGFDGDVMLLLYRGDQDEIVSEAEKLEISVACATDDNWGSPIQHYDKGRDTQCHQMRFFHMWQYLTSVPDYYRFVIATDVRDVYFQFDPSPWLLDNLILTEIVAPSEGLWYEHEPWGTSNMFDGYGPNVCRETSTHEIFNVGTIAGVAKQMKD